MCAAGRLLRFAFLLWLPVMTGRLAWAVEQFPGHPQERANPHSEVESEADAAMASVRTLIEQGRRAEAEAALRRYFAVHYSSAKASCPIAFMALLSVRGSGPSTRANPAPIKYTVTQTAISSSLQDTSQRTVTLQKRRERREILPGKPPAPSKRFTKI